MSYLFIDTCNGLTVGLLDDKFTWLEYDHYNEKKSSGVIHDYIYSSIKKNNISWETISNLFIMAGPGSYTGMRVSEGIAQVLEVCDITINSCYHFDIPQILFPDKSFVWISEAFKKEYFYYEFFATSGETRTSLLSKEEINSLISNNNFELYTILDFLVGNNNTHFDTTLLIKENPQAIFSFLLDGKVRKELFYYRSVDDEFKVKK